MSKKELIEYLVENYHEEKTELEKMKKEDLKELFNEYEDTSSMHPNETYEEYMEHENFD